jgi:hypothetical protein
MPIPRSPTGVRWLFRQTATYDFLICIFASAAGFATALNYLSQQRPYLAILVGGATFLVLAFTAAKHAITFASESRKQSTHELEGCLHTLHAVLTPQYDDCRLRLAVHVPVVDEEVLEQVTEYVGDKPKPGRIGRQYPINAGIIGKAYRENDVFIGRRLNDEYEAYVRELITEWNYTEQRARMMNPGTMEWMAVPLSNGGGRTVEAVLYLDANKRNFFTPDRQELVLAAVNGIAIFIGKRYS